MVNFSHSEMNRPISSKKKFDKKILSQVRFPDQIVFLESIKDSDIENVKSLLRRRSACIDMSSINNSGNINQDNN